MSIRLNERIRICNFWVMEPRSPSKFKLSITRVTQYKRALQISLSLFVVVLLLLLVGSYVRPVKLFNLLTNKSHYTVVIDCGSTGTRVNVHEWSAGGLAGEKHALPVLVHSYPDYATKILLGKDGCKYHCMQSEPGLDKFVGDYLNVRLSLEPLIHWAEQMVPSESHKDTPIFVLATAGLRRLAVEDAERVMGDVEDVVKEHSFLYRKSWIRVLSGKEEAYYGWVALNFVMGKLANSSTMSSLGLLDLGGTSLQVIMEVDESVEDEHLMISRIGSAEHRILTYSLPAFGLNEAFDRTVVMVSQVQGVKVGAGSTPKLRHPCFNSGLIQNYTCSGCAGVNSSGLASLTLIGDPHWERCRQLVMAAATNSSTSELSRLAVSSRCKAASIGVNLVNLTGTVPGAAARFHALSGFFVVYSMLNLSTRANMTKIWERGQQLCARSWDDLASKAENQKYAGQYCFRVPYMASLIEDALCLSNAEIYFGPGDVSWTLGAALVEGKNMWLRDEFQTGISTVKFRDLVSSPIFLFVVLLFLMFFVYQRQIKLPMIGKKAASGASLPSYLQTKCSPN